MITGRCAPCRVSARRWSASRTRAVNHAAVTGCGRWSRCLYWSRRRKSQRRVLASTRSGRICRRSILLARPRARPTHGQGSTRAPISLFDNICLQAERSYNTVQLQEQAASIAERLSLGVSPPQRCGLCKTIGTCCGCISITLRTSRL